ncbi:Alpha-1,6-mannosylglycoprotein 6-beta-N-acetylglucosaminyltransferase B [Sciurus carolinensis]|uniref:alpha-1,6-mannosyl-glycoprotein 6-beta-N-acetylglucosaminyltransferase n=1 Tax=Sciurus carolinensis TaxID=30640 RepID=A0AA41MMP5_SCICA|nr:Alpha-1,6-mannosylglycoprotein 6-beta-N-acetylglucosaminyltransferase B [Sciurus carolinensis]
MSSFQKDHLSVLKQVKKLEQALEDLLPRSPLNHKFFPGKPTSREEESEAAIKAIMETQDFCAAPSPAPSRDRGLTEPLRPVTNATPLEWAQNASMVPGVWPPPYSLRSWLATAGRTCMDACLDPRLVCEPSFFPFLKSQETFLQLQVPCDSTEWEMHHLHPALTQPGQECYLQKEPLLCSCTGSNTEYMEPFLPYEYTCGGSWSGPTPTFSTRTSVQLTAQPPPGTRASQSPFILAPNATRLERAQNASTVPGAWPPPYSLRSWLATAGRACMDACLDPRLLCERSFFPFLKSQEAFLQLQVPCDSTEWEMHHLYPALAQPGQDCYLQKEPLLCSCTGSNTKYQALPLS